MLIYRDIMAQEILLRGKINLHSSILDTPETYWDRHDLESLFEKTRLAIYLFVLLPFFWLSLLLCKYPFLTLISYKKQKNKTKKNRDSLDVTRRVSKLNATLQHLHQMVEVLKHDRQVFISFTFLYSDFYFYFAFEKSTRLSSIFSHLFHHSFPHFLSGICIK